MTLHWRLPNLVWLTAPTTSPRRAPTTTPHCLPWGGFWRNCRTTGDGSIPSDRLCKHSVGAPNGAPQAAGPGGLWPSMTTFMTRCGAGGLDCSEPAAAACRARVGLTHRGAGHHRLAQSRGRFTCTLACASVPAERGQCSHPAGTTTPTMRTILATRLATVQFRCPHAAHVTTKASTSP